MKICARCDKPIEDDEEYTVEATLGATAAGANLYFHKTPCKQPPKAQRPRTYPRDTWYRR